MNRNQALFPSLKRRGICAIKKMSRSNLSSRRRGGAKRKPDRAQPQEKIGEIFRPEEFRRTDHPVCGASEASRLFINAAATPPFKEGDVPALKQSVNSFTRSDAVGYVMTLASRANSAAQRRQEPSPGRKPWVVVTT